MILVSAALLAACQAGVPLRAGETAVTTRENVEYRLGASDQVRVIVFGEEALSGEFVVGSNGRLSLPLIGSVAVGGMTLREAETQIETSLADGYLNDPRVNVEVLNYRPFYILGEVEEAGEYPYTDGLTVMNAVATAGGFTYRANTRIAYIKRDGSNEEVAVQLTPSTVVQPGDTIRIGERFF